MARQTPLYPRFGIPETPITVTIREARECISTAFREVDFDHP
jgi:hypothetical protein